MQSPEIANNILQKKNKIGGIIPSNFKTYKATVVKTACFWCQERYINNEV